MLFDKNKITDMKGGPVALKRKSETKQENGFQVSKGLKENEKIISFPKKICQTGTVSQSAHNGPTLLSSSSFSSNKVPVCTVHFADLKSPSVAKKLLERQLDAQDILDEIKTYICKYCCLRFPNAGMLQMHLKTHRANPVHSCHQCGHKTTTFSALMAHFVKHSSFKNLSLSDASKKQKMLLSNPNVRKKPEIIEPGILCSHCKRMFNSKSLFNSHFCPPLNKKTQYVCTYCREVTTTVEDYRDHIQSHSTASFICNQCSSKFDSKLKLLDHSKVCVKKQKTNKVPNSSVGCSVKPESKTVSKFKIPKPKSTEPLTVTDAITKSDNVANSVSSDSAKPDDQVLKCDSELVKPKGTPGAHSDDTSSSEKEFGKLEVENTWSYKPVKSNLRSTRPRSFTTRTPPTRRSARLVNKEPVDFSNFSDDSDSGKNNIDECNENIRYPEESPTEVEHIASPRKKFEVKTISPRKKSEEPLILPETKSDDNIKSSSSCSTEIPLPQVEEQIPVSKNSKRTSKKPLRRRFKQKKANNNNNKQNSESKCEMLFCSICSLAFRCKGSLKRHKKMHSGKPQFVCKLCGKFFFRKDIHRRHENNVHANDTDKVLICYYCKETFLSSADLEQHAYNVHSKRASAPERIRRCIKVKKEIQEDFSVPQTIETHSPSVASMLVQPKTEITSYDCSICQVVFKSLTEHVSHLEDVHNIYEKPDIQKLSLQECSDNTMGSVCLSKYNTVVKTECPESHDAQAPNKVNQSLDSPVNTASLGKDSELENKELTTAECSTKSVGNDSYGKKGSSNKNCCKICFTSHVIEEASLPQKNILHKAVEWFQCSVCMTSGPRAKMQEHMLSHMSRVGIYIVNTNEQNFDYLKTYMPNLNSTDTDQAHDVPQVIPFKVFESNRACRTSFNSTITCLPNTQKTGILSELLNCKRTKSDFVSCTVNSVHTLMSEVKCIKCNEIIIDVEVLKHHPCLETGTGKFSCFVESCKFKSSEKDEAIAHLQFVHYSTVSPVVEVDETTFPDKVSEISDSCDSVQLRLCEVENIVMEPFIELISSEAIQDTET